VLPPHRDVELGEDPIFFDRPLVEFLDASNDGVLRDLHAGLVPRAWRSYLIPIWPRTAERFQLRFPFDRLIGETDALPDGLSLRITYLGSDLNRHGGDWAELDRMGMPTRLLANGHVLHDYMEPAAHTRSYDFDLPAEALQAGGHDAAGGAAGELVLSIEPKWPELVTFRYSTLPVAELWIFAPTEAYPVSARSKA